MFGEGPPAIVSQRLYVKDSCCTVVGNKGTMARFWAADGHRGQGRCVVWLRCVARVCVISKAGLLAIQRG
jgi:hypothetical protein